MRKYISYEELRDRYVELPDVRLRNEDEVAGYRKAISEILELMRTVHAVKAREGVVMYGHWKSTGKDYGVNYTCSACGTGCAVPTIMGEPKYEYCPNCGAVMLDEVANE